MKVSKLDTFITKKSNKLSAYFRKEKYNMTNFSQLLSRLIQSEQPQLLTEISIKLTDKLIARMDTYRKSPAVRSLYIYVCMYSILTHDIGFLMTILRLAPDSLLSLLKEAEKIKINSGIELNNSLIKQFVRFREESESVFTLENIVLALTLVKNDKDFNYNFSDAVFWVAKDYLPKMYFENTK